MHFAENGHTQKNPQNSKISRKTKNHNPKNTHLIKHRIQLKDTYKIHKNGGKFNFNMTNKSEKIESKEKRRESQMNL